MDGAETASWTMKVNASMNGVGEVNSGLMQLDSSLDQTAKKSKSLNTEISSMGKSASGIASTFLMLGTASLGALGGLAAAAPSLAGNLAEMEIGIMNLAESLSEPIGNKIDDFTNGLNGLAGWFNENPEVASFLVDTAAVLGTLGVFSMTIKAGQYLAAGIRDGIGLTKGAIGWIKSLLGIGAPTVGAAIAGGTGAAGGATAGAIGGGVLGSVTAWATSVLTGGALLATIGAVAAAVAIPLGAYLINEEIQKQISFIGKTYGVDKQTAEKTWQEYAMPTSVGTEWDLGAVFKWDGNQLVRVDEGNGQYGQAFRQATQQEEYRGMTNPFDIMRQAAAPITINNYISGSVTTETDLNNTIQVAFRQAQTQYPGQ